jgi:hypothetical protein
MVIIQEEFVDGINYEEAPPDNRIHIDLDGTKAMLKKYDKATISLLITLLSIRSDAILPIQWYLNHISLENVDVINEQNFTKMTSSFFICMSIVKLWELLHFQQNLLKPTTKSNRFHGELLVAPLFLSIPWIHRFIFSVYPRAKVHERKINTSLVLASFISIIAIYTRYKNIRPLSSLVTKWLVKN